MTEGDAPAVQPVEDTPPEPTPDIKTLTMRVTETADHQPVFDVTLTAFIESYNSLYRQTYKTDDLREAAAWSTFSDQTPFPVRDATLHQFSSEEDLFPLPTVSAYTPENSRQLYEIMLTFDDHSYQDSLYECFEERCLYALQVVLPAWEEGEIHALYEALYAQTKENFWGDFDTDVSAARPTLSTLFYDNGVGLYGYYGSGTANLCIIPVTQASLQAFAQDGIALCDLSGDAPSRTERLAAFL